MRCDRGGRKEKCNGNIQDMWAILRQWKLLSFFLTASALWAQTTPTISSVVNTYSSIGGTVAPGELITIYGSNLSNGTAAAPSTPLPTTLNGTQVMLGQTPLALFFVSPAQVNVVLPYSIQANAQLQVTVSLN